MDRKLDVGDTLSQAFSIYGAQAGVLLPLAFAFYVVVAVIYGLSTDAVALLPLAAIAGVVAATLYAGTVVQLVRDVQDGRRDQTVGQLLDSATPVILPLIGAGILAGIAISIGLLLLVVPGLILLTIWAVLAPVIVVERPGVFAAFGRSRELVRGNGWQVFGVIVSVFIIVFVVRAILGAIAVSIEDSALVRILFDIVASSITAPVTALVAAVVYFRLRAIEEGGAPESPPQSAGPPASEPPAPAV